MFSIPKRPDSPCFRFHLKGINALIDLAAQLGVNDPTLHFVAVVPTGDRVEFPVPKNGRFLLQIFCIEVREDELYGYANYGI